MDFLRPGLRLVFIVFATCAFAAFAEDKRAARVSYFDLPVQALQLSLVEFGLQARVTVIADHQLLEGRQSSPVIGPQTVETALRNLLSAAELIYRYDEASGAYIIEQPAPEAPQETPTPLTEGTPELSGIEEEVLVESLRYPFRYQTISNSQMLGDVSYFDSSRFINTLPSALLDDARPKEVGEALKYASGITPGDGLGDSNDDFYIRGFRRHAIYIDGFRSSDLTGAKLIPANLEHLEILKGPSTLLFGQAEPGGIVNAVRKKPREERFAMSETGVGSGGQRYITLDANTPVIDKKLDARLVIFGEAQDKNAELSNIERSLFAPSATFHLSPKTQLWASYEYQWEARELYKNFTIIEFWDPSLGLITLDDGVKSARPGFDTTSQFVSLGLVHYFADNWQFDAQYFWRDEDRRGVRASVDKIVGSGLLYDLNEFSANTLLYFFGNKLVVPRTFFNAGFEPRSRIGIIRSIYDELGFETNNNIKMKMDGTFDLAGWTHHLMFGSEWYQQDLLKDYTIESRNLFPGQSWTEDEFDNELIIIVQTVADPSQPLGSLTRETVRLLYDDISLFAQDVIELDEQWVLTVGGRYSQLEGEHMDVNQQIITPLETYQQVSGQVGVVYKVDEDHSLYANYSEALRANYHLDEFGANRAPPERSDQIEAGLKSMLLDGRMQSTLGVFKINKFDVSQMAFMIGQDLDTSAVQADQVIRGADLDVTLQASPKFDLLAGASILNAELVSGVNSRNTPVLTADRTLSFFGHYQLARDLELSGGIKHVSSRYLDNANINKIPAYETIDAALAWKKTLFEQEVTLRLGVINLLDEEYSLAGFYGSPPNLAEGRSFTAALRADW